MVKTFRCLPFQVGLPLLALLIPALTFAQQVPTDPTSTHIFPAGGRRGTTVNVRVGGECLPPLTKFRIEGPGLKVPEVLGSRAPFQGEPSPRRKPGESPVFYPKEWKSTVEIAEGASLGPRLWWLSCARGGTGGRPFLVGELPEFIETEPNSTPESAEPLILPVTLNGQIDGERDMDFFWTTASQGDVIVAEVVAARIGSPLEPVLEFRDEAGHRLRTQEVRVGNDSVIALRVPATGKIRFSVANLSVAGGPSYVYRMTLSKEPFARLAFPSGGQAGQSQDVELLTLTGDARFETLKQTVLLPSDLGNFWWRVPGQRSTLPLMAGALPELVENEPNDKGAEANKVSVPNVVNGRFAAASDEDWFGFDARAGQAISVDCQPAGVGLPSLPIISIHDTSGKELAKSSAVSTPDRFPAIDVWAPPADGFYWLRLRDVQQGVSAGPDFLYRVRLRAAKPDFELTLKNDWTNHVLGGRTEIDVLVRRRGGFAGPVKILVDGLPVGVRVDPLEIAAGAPSGKLVFTSDGSIGLPGNALLRISGTADVSGGNLTHVAVAPHLGQDAEGVSVGSPTSEHIHLTVQNKPLFRLFCSEAYQYAHRGTIHPYQMEVERFEGFNGPISLQIADRQIKDLDGAHVLDTTIPAGENRVLLPLLLPETMHINVQAHSNIYAQGVAIFQDRAGQTQSTCIVSEMRCMVRTLPTVARLQAVDRGLTLTADGSVNCRLRLDRTSVFGGQLNISLVDDSMSRGFTAEPVSIPPGKTDALVVVRRVPGENIPPETTLRFRGTGEMDGGTTILTEAVIPIHRPK